MLLYLLSSVSPTSVKSALTKREKVGDFSDTDINTIVNRTTVINDVNDAIQILFEIGFKKENKSFSLNVGFLATNTTPESETGMLKSILSSLASVIVRSMATRSVLLSKRSSAEKLHNQ